VPCPNCDHVMDPVGHGLYWCPGCGTQVGQAKVWTPKLVVRCRAFSAALRRIDESINLPADRPHGGA
jgi:hypothetical protein